MARNICLGKYAMFLMEQVRVEQVRAESYQSYPSRQHE